MQKERDRRQIALLLVVVSLVVILDQLSKLWARNNAVRIAVLPGFLDFTYIRNYGSVFGILTNQTSLLIIITIVSLIFLLIFFYHYTATSLGTISIGLIIGGALGNLIDRLYLTYVTEFIDIHLGDLFHWYTFNLADAAVVIGTFFFIYTLYRSGIFSKAHEHRNKNRDT